jgi:hypothetical protein
MRENEILLREKLAGEIGTVAWSWLRPHQERGVLFLVGEELELIEVAVAVAEDRAETIRQWLASGCLGRPDAEMVAAWENRGGLFRGVIVKPYVFFQPTKLTAS